MLMLIHDVFSLCLYLCTGFDTNIMAKKMAKTCEIEIPDCGGVSVRCGSSTKSGVHKSVISLIDLVQATCPPHTRSHANKLVCLLKKKSGEKRVLFRR